jgi:hypothetical protein
VYTATRVFDTVTDVAPYAYELLLGTLLSISQVHRQSDLHCDLDVW